MSLADELSDFFEEEEEILIQQPIKFKSMLGIGEQAYGLLQARKHMTTFSEVVGIGTTASSIAASNAMAGTFFASSGFMASALSSIGLGASAVTPIGWVIAAGVISSGAYVGVSRLLERSKDDGLIVIPKYINTPLDVIAVALIELMLPVSLKMANAGGDMDKTESNAIQSFFSDDWGYCPGFVSRLIEEYRTQTEAVSYEKLAKSLGTYCADSKDCDREAIMTSFIDHLREIIEADGVIYTREKEELDYLTGLLITESKKAGGSATVTTALIAASNGLTQSSKLAADMASSIGSATASGLSSGTAYISEKGRIAAEKSSKLLTEFSESGTVNVIKSKYSKLVKKQ